MNTKKQIFSLCSKNNVNVGVMLATEHYYPFTHESLRLAFIFQVLGADGSCKQAVASVLADRLGNGQTANSVNTGSYCKARQRLPLAPMKDVATNVGHACTSKVPKPGRVKRPHRRAQTNRIRSRQ
jgi:hypothetical protein